MANGVVCMLRSQAVGKKTTTHPFTPTRLLPHWTYRPGYRQNPYGRARPETEPSIARRQTSLFKPITYPSRKENPQTG